MREPRRLVLTQVEQASPAPPFIEFDRIGKTFAAKSGGVEAIRDVSFVVTRNQFVTIVGPSGCGKSTLLKMVAGLMLPSAGRITINGERVAGPTPDVGMVFQRPALLPWRTVLGNVLLPALMTGADRKMAMARAQDLLAMADLADFATKYPSELSGGMQQRVGICRALLCQPTLLLMDEPFAALDAMTREDMSVELLRIWENEPKTVLFVTHSFSEAILLADRVIIISARPGTVASIIDIDIPRPRDLATPQRLDFQEYAAAVRAAIYRRA